MRRSLLLLLLSAPARLVAQAELPPAAQKGLDELRDGRCDNAISLWTSQWPEVQKSQMAASCSALEQYGGSIRGYEILRVMEITPHLQRIYVLLLYETQPIYMMLVAYRTGERDWQINSVNWNTNPDKVVPPTILPPQHPGP